jgi:hypothetical protein
LQVLSQNTLGLKEYKFWVSRDCVNLIRFNAN